MLIQAPHGKQVADALSCEPERSNLRREKTQYIHRIEHCLSKFKARLYSIAIGDLGLKTDEAVMDPIWNRIYDLPNTNLNTTYWPDAIDRGGHPYFCPIGQILNGFIMKRLVFECFFPRLETIRHQSRSQWERVRYQMGFMARRIPRYTRKICAAHPSNRFTHQQLRLLYSTTAEKSLSKPKYRICRSFTICSTVAKEKR